MTATPSHGSRTRLAWRRTVLATAVVGILAARLGLRAGAPRLALLVGAVAAAGWVVVSTVAVGRRRGLSDGTPAVRRVVLTVAVATLGYAVLGLALVLLTPR